MNSPSKPSNMKPNRSMPPGKIIAELEYDDLHIAVAWLCEAFGFTEHLRIMDHRSQLVLGEASIIVKTNPSRLKSTLSDSDWMKLPTNEADHSIMVHIEDLDGPFEHAIQQGAKVVNPPVDYPYGERQYSIEAIEGHLWTFSQTIEDVDPSAWGGKLMSTDEGVK